ncbi:ArsR/SmtB family transcription factor [Rhodococcus opacus]|uniref:Putative ArsR family transcriptional regulator n=1 Tax=Rhodococcus opacus (strain B4) TaxID=632772 RepID=C1B635_RHOOB|nr:helix-turn-helix transcriptional regulator [Rhodococcus opacus]BAH55446.1 putative ArsR family transcriptional regulator [Rhodococcus opacus B4]
MNSEPPCPDKVARIARILADPMRLHLLTIIARAGEISCTHLVDDADVGPSTVSYHVKMLTEAGLVTVTIDGRHRYVRFERETLCRFIEIITPRSTMTHPTSADEPDE